MRWLRCLLSREFDIKNTLIFWDYIMGGIENKHRLDRRCKGTDFLDTDLDPLINLDYLCTAMIINIKKDLLESDFSMCMANLLNYPDQSEGENILTLASQIKQKLKEPVTIKTPNDYFDNLNRMKSNHPSP